MAAGEMTRRMSSDEKKNGVCYHRENNKGSVAPKSKAAKAIRSEKNSLAAKSWRGERKRRRKTKKQCSIVIEEKSVAYWYVDRREKASENGKQRHQRNAA